MKDALLVRLENALRKEEALALKHELEHAEHRLKRNTLRSAIDILESGSSKDIRRGCDAKPLDGGGFCIRNGT